MRATRSAVALIVLLALVPAVPAQDDDREAHVALPVPDTAPDTTTTGTFHGSGPAHGFGAGFRAGNVTQNWTLVAGAPVVARVASPSYDLICHEGAAHVRFSNGTLAHHDCTMLTGLRSLTVIVQGPDGRTPLLDTHVTADDANSTTYALAQDVEPPNPWPGFLVALAAVTFAAAALIVAWLYVQERRISRYLVRRLFEETQGRVPKEWPEHLRRRVIARFLVGGKN